MRFTTILPALALAAAIAAFASDAVRAQEADSEPARDAFLRVYEVFAHPRCVNCHSVGDRPLQTDAGVAREMNVQRGPDGKSRAGMRCERCRALPPRFMCGCYENRGKS